jgi:hypothetical protein
VIAEAAFEAFCLYCRNHAGNARQKVLGIIPIAAVDTKSIIGTVGLTSGSGSMNGKGANLVHGWNSLEVAIRSRIDTALRLLCIVGINC